MGLRFARARRRRGQAHVGRGDQRSGGLIDHDVGGVDVDDARLVGGELGLVVVGVADDDHPVARRHQPGGGAVEAEVARASLAGDHVGLEAGAVVDVDDGHLLAVEQVGELHELDVDRDRTHVVQVGIGHGGAMDFGLEHATAHVVPPDGGRPVRVAPWNAPF